MLSVNNRAQKVTRRKKIKENYKSPSKDFNAMLSLCGTTNLEHFPFFKSLGECSLALCNGPLKNIQQQLFFYQGIVVLAQVLDVCLLYMYNLIINCERCLWKAPLSSDGSTVNVRL